MTRRVLLTGGTGFIGRWSLSPLRTRNFEVHLVVPAHSNPLPEETGDAVIHRADLFDLSATAQLIAQISPSHLLHFAWATTPGLYWTSSDNFRWVEASLNLLRAFRRTGGERAVLAGSCAEYDWNRATICHEFDTPLAAQGGSAASPYAACKSALSEMLMAFARTEKMSAAWGRIFFLYGPYERPERLVPSIVHALLQGKPALCSHGRQLRNFLLAKDIADAFVTLLDSGVEGPVNIGSDEHVTIGQLAQQLGEIAGRPELIRLGARPSPIGEPDILVPDVTRLYQEVCWRPKQDLSSGLAETLAWWCKSIRPVADQSAPSSIQARTETDPRSL